ncbi:MAG TPA: methyltransferase domain-containing protein [Symbiobacteriaceae bacterium]|nr:methyltransferase domain-containing protein [Symbiobacteriaceae bacterium]
MGAFFHPGAPTADIGCGSGRNVAWLLEQKFPAIGYDASQEALRHARASYRGMVLGQSSLPDLATIPSAEYGNVLCTALMHVGREHLITAVLNLARVLRDGGRLVLTLQGSRGAQQGEANGRIFPEIPRGRLTLLLEAAGLHVIDTQTQTDMVVPEVEWTVLLAEKGRQQVSRGLERLQSVLVQDQKTATYKYALIRALCSISRTEPHTVRWDRDKVLVPMRSIAVRWLTYYWPLLAPNDRLVAQLRGEAKPGGKPLAFRKTVAALVTQYSAGGRLAFLQDLEQNPDRFIDTLVVFRDTIKRGPVEFAGTKANRLFQYVPRCPQVLSPDPFDDRLGWVEVPESIWLDISRFNHWIEESLILRWAQLTAEMNGDPRATGEFLQLLLDEPEDERTTAEVREVLLHLGHPLTCVWSGKTLEESFHVDHVIPYSAWGNNDWWNMLPSRSSINLQKSDSLPTQALLVERRECIVGYWREYFRRMPERFGRQVRRGLGISVGHTGWERVAFAGLQETVERVALVRGLARWAP